MIETHHVDLVSSDVNCSTNTKMQENVIETVKEKVLNSEPYFEVNQLDIKQVVCGMNNCFILMQDGKYLKIYSRLYIHVGMNND